MAEEKMKVDSCEFTIGDEVVNISFKVRHDESWLNIKLSYDELAEAMGDWDYDEFVSMLEAYAC